MAEIISFLESFFQCLVGGGGDVQMAIAPVLIAAGISAAASIGSSIFGSSQARKEKRRQLKAIEKQKAENRNWYNRRYYEDATQRADAQRMLTRTNDAIKKRTQAAYGRKAVVGGTDATLASTQQANAEAMGNAMGDIVANAEARKDDIEQQYRSRQQELDAAASNVRTSYSQARRENVANAATGVMNAAASVVANSGDTGASKTSGGNGTTATGALAKKLGERTPAETLDEVNRRLSRTAGSVLRGQRY